MDDIAQDLLGPGGPELVGLGDGVGDTDEALAVEAFRRGAVVEGDDIGGTLVPEEPPVHTGHLRRRNPVEPQFGLETHGLQQIEDDPSQGPDLERPIFLSIAQDEDDRIPVVGRDCRKDGAIAHDGSQNPSLDSSRSNAAWKAIRSGWDGR